MKELKTYVYNGRTTTCSELAQIAGIDQATMYNRLQYMTVEKAVNMPLQEQTRYFLGLRVLPLDEIAWELGTDVQRLRSRSRKAHKSLQVIINEAFDEKARVATQRKKEASADVDRPLSDHWCFGCEWAKWLGDRCSCPFVIGSCVKLPRTMANPDINLVKGDDFRRKKADLDLKKRIAIIKLLHESEAEDGEREDSL